jgi:aquaporin Z
MQVQTGSRVSAEKPAKAMVKGRGKLERDMQNRAQTDNRGLRTGEAVADDFRLAGPQPLIQLIRDHLPEYVMEAFGLCLFMISACMFGTLIGHPDSPVHQSIGNPLGRRLLMGLAMGLTAILNIYSPWGKQSGAHLNPATTLTFFRLGKVKGRDALFYALAQFIGGALGVWIAAMLMGNVLSHRSVNYVATQPGDYGLAAAFIAEIIITFILFSVVLRVSSNEKIARFTGVFVGFLVAAYITVEDPFSGMSMNPARTLASALFAQSYASLWIYFIAPPAGMLLAAEVYLRLDGKSNPGCAKLHHQNNRRCIHCGDNP